MFFKKPFAKIVAKLQQAIDNMNRMRTLFFIGKRIIFFVLLSLHIFPLYSDNGSSSLFLVRDFLFMERMAADLREAENWAKQHELYHTRDYTDAVSQYCNDMAREYTFDFVKERMLVDLSKQLYVPDSKPPHPSSQDSLSNARTCAPITPPAVFQYADQQYFFSGDHVKTCSTCPKNVYTCEKKAYYFITNQAAGLHKKYESAKKKAQQWYAYNQQQRNVCMQEIFTGQMPNLDAVALEWQENNPERAHAYEETIKNPKNIVRKQYAVSQQVSDCLARHGFDAAEYQGLYGNPLQQELFREVLDGIELLAQLPQVKNPKPFDDMIRTATVETLDDARKVNEMGDCVGASKLIDFGTSLAGYCAAAGGFVSGVRKGITDACTSIQHIANHPDALVTAMGLIVVQFGDLIYHYVPFDDLLSDTFDDQDFDRISKNWAKERSKIVHWWEKTPSYDKMHQVVEVPVGFFTNAIVFGCCASFAGKIAKAAGAEALALLGKPNPSIASACAATSESAAATAVQRAKEEAIKLLEKLSEVEKVAQAPANTLMNEVIHTPNCWSMPEKGCVINNRYYTKHALERMAPRTQEVIRELEHRALAKGYPRGSDDFKKYVNPRNIPPMVVEHIIETTTAVLGKVSGTFEHITKELKVMVNAKGDVITVFKY